MPVLAVAVLLPPADVAVLAGSFEAVVVWLLPAVAGRRDLR